MNAQLFGAGRSLLILARALTAPRGASGGAMRVRSRPPAAYALGQTFEDLGSASRALRQDASPETEAMCDGLAGALRL